MKVSSEFRLFAWETYARLARELVLSTNGPGYAFAIRTLGVHPAKVCLKHVLPNIASVLIAQVILNFPDIMLLETSLSFLGLWVQPPPATSLGGCSAKAGTPFPPHGGLAFRPVS